MEQETNQDAQQDITSQGKPPQVLSIIGFFLILVIILTGLGAVGFLALKAKNLPEGKLTNLSKTFFPAPSLPPISTVEFSQKNSPIATNAAEQVKIIANSYDLLIKDITTTFTDPGYSQIIQYMKQGHGENNFDDMYKDYKKAFDLMSQAYINTQDVNFYRNLIELKSYASRYPLSGQITMNLPQFNKQ